MIAICRQFIFTYFQPGLSLVLRLCILAVLANELFAVPMPLTISQDSFFSTVEKLKENNFSSSQLFFPKKKVLLAEQINNPAYTFPEKISPNPLSFRYRYSNTGSLRYYYFILEKPLNINEVTRVYSDYIPDLENEFQALTINTTLIEEGDSSEIYLRFIPKEQYTYSLYLYQNDVDAGISSDNSFRLESFNMVDKEIEIQLPNQRQGVLWHVLDYFPYQQETYLRNILYPQLGLLYGFVYNAFDGAALSNLLVSIEPLEFKQNNRQQLDLWQPYLPRSHTTDSDEHWLISEKTDQNGFFYFDYLPLHWLNLFLPYAYLPSYKYNLRKNPLPYKEWFFYIQPQYYQYYFIIVSFRHAPHPIQLDIMENKIDGFYSLTDKTNIIEHHSSQKDTYQGWRMFIFHKTWLQNKSLSLIIQGTHEEDIAYSGMTLEYYLGQKRKIIQFFNKKASLWEALRLS